jgi:hypothetical protein
MNVVAPPAEEDGLSALLIKATTGADGRVLQR